MRAVCCTTTVCKELGDFTNPTDILRAINRAKPEVVVQTKPDCDPSPTDQPQNDPNVRPK